MGDIAQSNRFYEKLPGEETITAKKLKDRLKEVDIDTNNCMCVSEYLLYKYKKTPEALVDAPQGSLDMKELEQAEALCAEALDACIIAEEEKKKADAAEAPVAKAQEELE